MDPAVAPYMHRAIWRRVSATVVEVVHASKYLATTGKERLDIPTLRYCERHLACGTGMVRLLAVLYGVDNYYRIRRSIGFPFLGIPGSLGILLLIARLDLVYCSGCSFDMVHARKDD